MAEAVFEFDLRLAEADSEGYYITRWDRARKISAYGKTEKEAAAKAAKVLGAPRPGRCWVFRCDGIREAVTSDD